MSIQSDRIERPLLDEMATKCSRLNIPLQAQLELPSRCNIRCSHCYVDLVETDEMSFEEWRDVLSQLKAAGTIYLLLTGGEIMVRTDLLDLITYARSNGFLVGIITNCTLVTPEIVQAFSELRIRSIVTSLHGATAASHDMVTQVPGSFQRTLQGIQLLVDAGLVPSVQTMAMKNNAAELLRIKELVESLGAHSRIGIEMIPAKSGSNHPSQFEPGIEDLLSSGWQPDIRSWSESQSSQLCEAGKAVCAISPRGDVFPCISFPLRLGNLRESSFNSMWYLESCAELRYLRSMRCSDLLACNGCELRAYCQRCTGSAYLESGRIDGPSPSACRQAQTRWRLNLAEEVRS